jgi:hypothetical protein
MLGIFFSGFILSCQNPPSNASLKKLAITHMGFKSDEYSPITPGKSIQVYAVANKKNNVSYTWELPGEWKNISPGTIEWTVPATPGEYKVTATASDPSLGQSASHSSTVTVVDGAALAAPDSFSCSVKARTTMVNKLIGEKTISTSSKVDMSTDGEVSVETTTPVGEKLRTFTEKGATYSISPDGVRTLLSRDDKSIPDLPVSANLVSLESLKAACPTWTSDGRRYTFEQSSGTKQGLVIYDSLLGVVTRMRSEDEESGDVQDISMAYRIFDGFLIPTHIEGSFEYVVADEPYSVRVVQDLEDIVINGDESSTEDSTVQ